MWWLAPVSAIPSQEESPQFEPTVRLAPFYVDFANFPPPMSMCVLSGTPDSSHILKACMLG